MKLVILYLFTGCAYFAYSAVFSGISRAQYLITRGFNFYLYTFKSSSDCFRGHWITYVILKD